MLNKRVCILLLGVALPVAVLTVVGYGFDSAFAAEAGHGAEAMAHGAAAEAGEHHEGSAGLPQLDATTFPSQLFWLLVTFGILYTIFSKKSLPEISGVLENRQQHIQSDLETAERLRSEAEQAQHAYEASLGNARRDATHSLQVAQDSMKAKAEKQNDAFRKKSEKEIQDLEKRLQQAKQEAMDEMNTIAAEVASEAAKKIVGINPDLQAAKDVVKALNDGTKAKAA